MSDISNNSNKEKLYTEIEIVLMETSIEKFHEKS